MRTPRIYDRHKALEVDARDTMELYKVRLLAAEVLLCEARRVALEKVAMHVVERALIQLKTVANQGSCYRPSAL